MRYILAALGPAARVACATARSAPAPRRSSHGQPLALDNACAAPPERIAETRTALPIVAGTKVYED